MKAYKNIDEYVRRQVFCKVNIIENYEEEFLKATGVKYYDGAPIYCCYEHLR